MPLDEDITSSSSSSAKSQQPHGALDIVSLLASAETQQAHLAFLGLITTTEPQRTHRPAHTPDQLVQATTILEEGDSTLWYTMVQRPTGHIGVARWLSGRASDLRSKSRGFEARP